MRRTFFACGLTLSAICALSLFGSPAFAQRNDRDKDRTNEHPNGIVQDWSGRHLAYPRFGPIRSLIAIQNDPRAILSWQAAEREDWHRARNPRHSHGLQDTAHRDWSISLGAGTTAPAMYPAKFTFDPTASPSCAADFVVFPVAVTASGTQPNIVAFNNLYSGGTSGAPTGLCGSRTVVAGDDRSSATTVWSYNISAAGGQVPTSPALSLDGTRVAFVESAPTTTAHFHVLAGKAGDGVDTTTPDAQNVLLPVSITTGFATLAPVAGSGTVTDLALGATSDTLSSPFVDYNLDVAYIGNDSGTLYRVKNVFCTTPACTGGGTPAPSLDLSWPATGGTALSGSLTVCAGQLTGAVAGGADGNIFVGCSDGKLYGFTPAGAPLAGSPVTVGNGTATGGIVDPPLVDAVNGYVYAASGNSGGGTSVLVQASAIDLSSPVTAALGFGGSFNLHAPSFNAAYFNSGTSTDWMIYDWALNPAGTLDTLWGVTFTGLHVMNGGPAANSFVVGATTPVEFSPTTEFLNGATDQLFVGALTALSPNIVEENINTFPGAVTTGVTEEDGSSGIIVDNDSGSAQASSIYFGAQTANTAVKLTQSGLN